MTRDGMVHPLAATYPSLQTPSEWCSGCGLGIVLQCVVRAGQQCGLTFPGRLEVILSGLGCLGLLSRTAGFPAQVVPPQELLPQAYSLTEKKPEKRVIILTGEADVLVGGWEAVLPASPGTGRKQFRNAQSEKIPLTEVGPKSGLSSSPTPPPEEPTLEASNRKLGTSQIQSRVIALYINSGLLSLFSGWRRKIPWPGKGEDMVQLTNLPAEARRRGAASASRWTPLHVRRLTLALKQVLLGPPGFHFLEIISPCLLVWADKEKLGEVVERLEWLRKSCDILAQAPPEKMVLDEGKKITIGFLRED